MKRVALVSLLSFAATFAHAAEDAVGGSLRTGYFSGTRQLDDAKELGAASLWLRAAPRLGESAVVVADGWLRNDDLFRSGSTRGKLREGYIELAAGDADLRIGRQIIVWGRADELNPTDNISPRDFTLMTPEAGEQRSGTTAVRARYHLGEYTVTGILSPRGGSHAVPMAATPGVAVTTRRPSSGPRAVKLERVGAAMDWSVSYMAGPDLYPDIRIESMGPARVQAVLENRDIRVLGVDAARVAGSYGLRAEAAYTWTENGAWPDFLVKKPFLYAVLGVDRTFDGNLNVNVQYYFRKVSGYSDPQGLADPAARALATSAAVASNQRDRLQHGMSFRLAKTWMNDTLEAEFAGVYSLSNDDYVLRPKLVYAVNDQLKATAGAELFRGRDDTYFGRLRKMSTVFAEMKYSF